jgi:hypothetical protein
MAVLVERLGGLIVITEWQYDSFISDSEEFARSFRENDESFTNYRKSFSIDAILF